MKRSTGRELGLSLPHPNSQTSPRHRLLTSMGTQEGVVGDGPWLCKGVELVEPFSGHVEAEQAGFPHGSQGHYLLPLTHGLLTALPGMEGVV